MLRLVADKRFEPEASQYVGPAERFTCNLKGPPEQLLPVGIASQLIQFVVSNTQAHGGVPLKITVWADIAPTLYTAYKVELIAHGSPAIPWSVIVIAIAAAIVAIGLAIVTWKASPATWGGISLMAIAVIIGLLIWASQRKEGK